MADSAYLLAWIISIIDVTKPDPQHLRGKTAAKSSLSPHWALWAASAIKSALIPYTSILSEEQIHLLFECRHFSPAEVILKFCNHKWFAMNELWKVHFADSPPWCVASGPWGEACKHLCLSTFPRRYFPHKAKSINVQFLEVAAVSMIVAFCWFLSPIGFLSNKTSTNPPLCCFSFFQKVKKKQTHQTFFLAALGLLEDCIFYFFCSSVSSKAMSCIYITPLSFITVFWFGGKGL